MLLLSPSLSLLSFPSLVHFLLFTATTCLIRQNRPDNLVASHPNATSQAERRSRGVSVSSARLNGHVTLRALRGQRLLPPPAFNHSRDDQGAGVRAQGRHPALGRTTQPGHVSLRGRHRHRLRRHGNKDRGARRRVVGSGRCCDADFISVSLNF